MHFARLLIVTSVLLATTFASPPRRLTKQQRNELRGQQRRQERRLLRQEALEKARPPCLLQLSTTKQQGTVFFVENGCLLEFPPGVEPAWLHGHGVQPQLLEGEEYNYKKVFKNGGAFRLQDRANWWYPPERRADAWLPRQVTKLAIFSRTARRSK